MSPDSRKVCVLGAGTMGSGIAAHLANLGFNVTLLDATAESVRGAFERAQAVRPPHFYLSGTADLIRLGSVEENLDWVGEADWVCEAIIEKLEAKRALYRAVEPLLKPGAMVSTNTSGLQISLLKEGMGDAFRRTFLGTHFFNPPRHLKLLELIPTDETDPAIVDSMTAFLEAKVARRVVVAKDTPGFIANRYGMWSMFMAVHAAEKLGLTVEEVDAITGPFLGRPRTGSFRLNDLVGLDIMADIAANLVERCPHDPATKHLTLPSSLQTLIERGWTGAKAGQGYYRKEGKELVSFDLKTLAYRERQEPELATLTDLGRQPLHERICKALQARDQVGEFLRAYLTPTLRYACDIKEEISHNVRDFDRVMKWGFGWESGPFETIDAIGAENLGITTRKFYEGAEVLGYSGAYFLPSAEPQFMALTDYPVIQTWPKFLLRDMGDGVTAVSLTTKMGVFDPDVVRDMATLIQSGEVKRLVLTSESRSYSAGFDLKFFVSHMEAKDYGAIDDGIAEFQRLGVLLGTLPSVAAVWRHCLGGGFEMAASCSLIAATAETQIGLPEVKVGLIPGGGGTALMRTRGQANGPKGLVEAVKSIATGTLSDNADDARRLGFLRPEDVTVYHPDMLFTEAKRLALQATARGSSAWAPIEGPVAGMIDRALQELKSKGLLTDHDITIVDQMKPVFARATSYEDALTKERNGFVAVCKEGLSQARARHMLENGKPLRN
ncbi:MAG: enoyl-CoA hydratase/isomerase family protein [Armatimonadetes bacterium]|nr:enoyl-CoA hydratase/isomerase family protein [Armatimonadota bacterium]